MQTLFLILIILAWLAGGMLRIYRQARFYQIEEYKSGRYLRWWLAKRDHWLLRRPLAAFIIGGALAFFLSEASESPLPGIIALAATLIAVWPPREREIKKAFRRTERATRLLGASFLLATFDLGLYVWLASRLRLDDYALQVLAVMCAGLVMYLTVPLILTGGNLLMMPVEAALRRMFIARARAVMARVRPVVIGITGSYGKTTTKNFITDILNGRYKAYATPKSYNTMMGVCIAINNDLKDDYSIEYFVVEMGAYIRGEIQRICDLTPPQISVVVDVGPQHLERFGSLETIAAAKYEIIKALPDDGVGIFNWDNPYVRAMYERGYPRTRLAVSKTIDPAQVMEGGPRFVASEVIETLDGLRFTMTDTVTGEKIIFSTPLLGEHNVTNILLATAVAVHEGMSLQDVAARVRTLRPAESRLVKQVSDQGITIINDAYSANPVGAVSALRVLGMHTGGRRLVITPGMVELADLHEQENYKLGQAAARYATDAILVGEEQTRPIKAGLLAEGFSAEHLRVVQTLREAIDWYQANFKPGDTVLFLNDLPDTY